MDATGIGFSFYLAAFSLIIGLVTAFFIFFYEIFTRHTGIIRIISGIFAVISFIYLLWAVFSLIAFGNYFMELSKIQDNQSTIISINLSCMQGINCTGTLPGQLQISSAISSYPSPLICPSQVQCPVQSDCPIKFIFPEPFFNLSSIKSHRS